MIANIFQHKSNGTLRNLLPENQHRGKITSVIYRDGQQLLCLLNTWKAQQLQKHCNGVSKQRLYVTKTSSKVRPKSPWLYIDIAVHKKRYNKVPYKHRSGDQPTARILSPFLHRKTSDARVLNKVWRHGIKLFTALTFLQDPEYTNMSMAFFGSRINMAKECSILQTY